MSQHDLSIANQGFPAFRSDLNDALQALGSMQSGTSAPSTTYANMLWYDTTNNIVKMRNEDNDAWISLFTLDQSGDLVSAISAATGTFGTLSATGNVTLGDSSSDTATVNAKTTFGSEISAPNTFGFKNRIINGAMMIDQRNAGAAITTNGYSVDRFEYANFTDGAFSVQQDTTAPAGFIKSLKVTVTSADASVTTNQSAFISQKIEGLNCSDLGWGAAGASSVTFSFWVRSSLTGTFGGSFRNNATDRSYPYSYTISAANTWEQKTVTIAGDTTGTWLTTNGVGINIGFSLAAGPSVVGTASTWAAANYVSASGSTNLVSTNGATFYITGVQLEKGSTATAYDYRPYGTELALCQRYFYRMQNDGANTAFLSCAGESSSTMAGGGGSFPVPMRTVPTPTLGAGIRYYSNSSGNITPTINTNRCSSTTFSLLLNGTSITAGQGGAMYNSTTNGYVDLSAEL